MLSPQQIQAALDRCFGYMTDPQKYYVILPYGIGDFVISGSLVYALLKKFNRQNATLIMQERFRNLEIAFDGVSEIKYLPYDELMIVSKFVLNTKRYVGQNYFYGHFRWNFEGKDVTGGRWIFVEQYKAGVYDLPLDTPLHYPIVKDVSDEIKSELRQKYELDKARTVILMPYANSLPLMSINFWQQCVQSLLQRGYRLYTNVGRRPNGTFEQPLPGTLPLDVGLNEIFYVAGQVKCIVGYRSGLFDLLVFSKGNLICLAPQGMLNSDVKLNFPNTPSRLRPLYYDFNFFPKLNELLSQFEIESMSVANVKHKKIAPENLFFDEQNLLAAVLRAVEAL